MGGGYCCPLSCSFINSPPTPCKSIINLNSNLNMKAKGKRWTTTPPSSSHWFTLKKYNILKQNTIFFWWESPPKLPQISNPPSNLVSVQLFQNLGEYLQYLPSIICSMLFHIFIHHIFDIALCFSCRKYSMLSYPY